MTGRIVVVGLGPGPLDLLTAATLREVERIPHRYLRTSRHDSASAVPGASTFDHLYESGDTFDEVYRHIVETLVEAANDRGEVLYAVPGSPFVLETTVQLLLADDRVQVTALPAMSFLDRAWALLGIDPVNAGVRLVDGHRFVEQAAGECGPLLVAQVHDTWVMSDVKLAYEDATGDEEVLILHHLGLPDERLIRTTWQELDRVHEPDHLTCLYIPRLASPIAGEMQRLHRLARTLRERCPWDQEQTHASLIKHLIEETYEVVDAVNALDANDPATDQELIEELGDLLYQVEFHATIAEQEGRFTLSEVVQTLHDKLVRRHPHVFGDVQANTADDVVDTWDSVKRTERGESASIFDGVAKSSPSLSYSQKVQKRAAGVGFDWPDHQGALDKIVEESKELASASGAEAIEMELGDLLFSVGNVARHLGVDAESALRRSTDKFRRRFEEVERLARARSLELSSLSLEELDGLWNEAKANLGH
ncbi:MAG: nucleoside triphosphate pyrophosphohydrolase [Ilumatobacteraceae bacterium]